MQMQDRSDSAELGTQVFFGDFRTFETLSIFKLEAGSDDSESPEQLLERVIAEQRDNASTFGFTLISGPVPAPRTVADDDASSSATTTYYDSEYVDTPYNSMLLPSCCCHHAAAIMLLPSCCCHHAAAIMLLPSCCCHHAAITHLLALINPPHCCCTPL
jgi:hypothetical protein